MAKQKDLTEKQERFCQFYIDTDGNASEAYRLAYNTSGMKNETIWSAASRMFDNYKVVARIKEIKIERAVASKVDRDKINSELMAIATFDINELYYIDPVSGKTKMRGPHQLSKKARMAVRVMRNNKGVVTYDMHGKLDAIRQLASMNGWNAPQQVNVNNNGSVFGELRIGFDEEEK